jgi:hypothetical protein
VSKYKQTKKTIIKTTPKSLIIQVKILTAFPKTMKESEIKRCVVKIHPTSEKINK